MWWQVVCPVVTEVLETMEGEHPYALSLWDLRSHGLVQVHVVALDGNVGGDGDVLVVKEGGNIEG